MPGANTPCCETLSSAEGLSAGRRNGGAEGIRTPDPKTASLVLSQLSYSPTRGITLQARAEGCQGMGLVGERGLEPLSPCGQQSLSLPRFPASPLPHSAPTTSIPRSCRTPVGSFRSPHHPAPHCTATRPSVGRRGGREHVREVRGTARLSLACERDTGRRARSTSSGSPGSTRPWRSGEPRSVAGPVPFRIRFDGS